ncbi:glycosyltransferase family 4 protein [Virgibacillus sp. 179-BFC.A HS]|uniref:Glycosyltransferase family 4 protein n=1 Tax=Tigheibacillus jepli TaxID=3035914 RepID=A0ABU5CEF0_9BACI|nr:glycosyltransferase family 4 protein [Virgibacillus sp. 179-BFC.A HS]MDY0404718.1 glycosyltransferase family 4 protein [Virgibacillus sp. 179-BFC.A HS]
MKVLFLARYLPQTGSTTHIYTLARGLMQRGHEVYLMSSGPANNKAAINIFNQIKKEGMKHYKVCFPNHPNFHFLGKVIQLVKYIAAVPSALHAIKKIKPDIVHVHYPVTSYIAKLYKMISGKKFIVTHHISGIPKHPLYKKADYIAISRELKEELIDRFHYSEQQIRLIFNGVSRDTFDKDVDEHEKQRIKEELKLPHDKPIIGFAGSINSRKGVDVLLAACNLVKKDFHIVLLGDGDKEWIHALIKKNNLSEKISIFPFQDPLPFYAIFDIFVLPSRKEGFPLVPIEAMMMGTPVIRSNVEGASDQIESGYNGYIFDNENSNMLAEQIDSLLENEKLRVEMGNNAKNLARSKFTEKNMINQLLNLYQEIK